MVSVERLDSSHSHPAPAIQLLPVIQLLPAILPAIAVPGLHLLFPLDCTCGCGARIDGRLIRGRLVGERKFVREGRVSASHRRSRRRQGEF